jgi:hypothetical protein
MRPLVIGLAVKNVGRYFLLGSVVGCAQLNDAGLAIISSNVPAFAIVDGQLMQGEIQLFPDHTGAVSLQASVSGTTGQSGVTDCVGRLRYTATNTGAIDMRCTGGVAGDLKMTLLGDTRGYGYGATASGAVSLVFGMTAQESRAYLIPTADRQLVERASGFDPALRK